MCRLAGGGLGNGANILTGTAPTYTIASTDYHDVGGALGAVDSSVAMGPQALASGTNSIATGTNAQATANTALALGANAASLRYDDGPGKISAAAGGGAWCGQGAFAMGIGYTSMNQTIRANVSTASTGGNRDIGGGVSFTLN